VSSHKLQPPAQHPWQPVWTPRISWTVAAPVADLVDLQDYVPGLAVWSRAVGAGPRFYKAHNLPKKGLVPEGLPIVTTPVHGWWLAERALTRWEKSAPLCDERMPTPWQPDDAAWLARLTDEGNERWRELEIQGLLRSNAGITPQHTQARNLTWASGRRSNALFWAPGAGKTLGAESEALQSLHELGQVNGGRVLTVCPGRAKAAWQRQVPRYANVAIFRHDAPSDRPVGALGREEYLQCVRHGMRPMGVNSSMRHVVIGGELDDGVSPAVIEHLVARLPKDAKITTLGSAGRVAACAAKAQGRPLQPVDADPRPLVMALRALTMRPQAVCAFGDSPLARYLEDASGRLGLACQRATPGQVLPITWFVYGLESIELYLQEVVATKPHVLILDELHRMGARDRWDGRETQEGTTEWSRKKAKGGARERLAVALRDIGHSRSIRHTIGMTATPVGTGKPRRLWAQFDLLEPGSWGSYWNFAKRHCYNAKEPITFGGGPSDEGASHIEELKLRTLYFRHEVTYEESHGSLPPTRLTFPRLTSADQDAVTGYAREIKGWSKQTAKSGQIDAAALPPTLQAALQKRGGVIEDVVDAAATLREARIAEATEAKFSWVVDRVLSFLRGGGKAVVFVNRKAIAEKWAAKLASRLKREAKAATQDFPEVLFSWGHGDVPAWEREADVEKFRQHDGPALHLGTSHAYGESVDGFQVADYFCLASVPDSVKEYLQQRGRADRHNEDGPAVPTLIEVPIAEQTYDEHVIINLVNQCGTVQDFRAALELDGVPEGLLGWEFDVQSAEMGHLLAESETGVSELDFENWRG